MEKQVICVLFALIVSATLSTDFYDVCDQAAALDMPCEHHTVTTEDGFQLLMIRIPPNAPGAYPVILQHGLFDTAVTWVANYYPRQNLACMLHDAGYDVWLPNSRGNHYSMNNTMINSSENAYWRAIDKDGMAKYDVPANIDYVLAATNRTTLTFVGHSQGGFQGFAAFGTVRPEYAKKVDLFVALAPACYVTHTTSVLLKLSAELDLDKILELFGVRELSNNDYTIRQIAKFCKRLGQDCPDVLELFSGDGVPCNTNASQLAVIARYDPGGTSVNNMIHWSQGIRRGTFAMHDYGPTENMKLYGNTTAPRYYLTNMTGPPTAVFWGTRDAAADPTDIATLLSLVPSSTIVLNQSVPEFAHLDFVWGLDAHRVLYPQVVDMIAEYRR